MLREIDKRIPQEYKKNVADLKEKRRKNYIRFKETKKEEILSLIKEEKLDSSSNFIENRLFC